MVKPFLAAFYRGLLLAEPFPTIAVEIVDTVNETSNGSRCRGLNRVGQPCGRRAVRDGWCTVHHPELGQDMRAIGRLGGRGRTRSMVGIDAGEAAREKGRMRLIEALDDPDSIVRLQPARALYAYGPVQPDRDHDEVSATGRRAVATVLQLVTQAQHEEVRAAFAADPDRVIRLASEAQDDAVPAFQLLSRLRAGEHLTERNGAA
jgi:hypothetical protein